MSIRATVVEFLLFFALFPALLFGCAAVQPPPHTYLMVDFTSADVVVTQDATVAIDWTKSDEFLVLDITAKDRLYDDGSRRPLREIKSK